MSLFEFFGDFSSIFLYWSVLIFVIPWVSGAILAWTQFDHTYSKFVNLSQLYCFLFYIISILRPTKKFLAELMNQLFLNMIDQLWWYCWWQQWRIYFSFSQVCFLEKNLFHLLVICSLLCRCFSWNNFLNNSNLLNILRRGWW